jgi:hypothetical protein
MIPAGGATPRPAERVRSRLDQQWPEPIRGSAGHFHSTNRYEIEDQHQRNRYREKREQVEHSLSPFLPIPGEPPQRPNNEAHKANCEFKVREKPEHHCAPKDNDPDPRPSFFELLQSVPG